MKGGVTRWVYTGTDPANLHKTRVFLDFPDFDIFPMLNRLLSTADTALRTLFAPPPSRRPPPPEASNAPILNESEQALSGALMRVNHVGEICAQALYTAQALATRNAALRAQYEQAAREEGDHLAWTRQRLEQLSAAPSVLNPLWYAGAFGLGLIAGRLGDPISLGFVVETERQVEAHLQSHLNRLPAADLASRAIVRQMKDEEAQHADKARHAGARALPVPARALMKAAARVMTTTAHYI